MIDGIVVTTCDTTEPPLSATSEALAASCLACLALSAFCFTVAVASPILAAVSSRLEACSSVRWDREDAAVLLTVLPSAVLVPVDFV